ncbi:unnamed protein product [Vicia faba]|uniref:Uncharacterized protein n=1 Tax=Vicia faba TaxID=3906 RepID=A0AAV0ZMV5_VICFA|nr:unnamed protein product [Vicia faba]
MEVEDFTIHNFRSLGIPPTSDSVYPSESPAKKNRKASKKTFAESSYNKSKSYKSIKRSSDGVDGSRPSKVARTSDSSRKSKGSVTATGLTFAADSSKCVTSKNLILDVIDDSSIHPSTQTSLPPIQPSVSTF